MFVDSHCHLDYPDFETDGLAAVIARAGGEGVSHFLTISTRIVEFPKILAVAEKFPSIHCTVGTHPHHAEEPAELNVSPDEIVKFTTHDKVVGVGETGLDYHYNHSPAADQKKVFAAHIEAALAANLPLVIHTREADDDTIDILRAAGQGRARGVMHCFSGGIDLAKKSLDLGFYISFSGIVTFKKADDIRQVVKYVPLDRILIETDCPYLAPVPHRGKRNEPAFVVHTAETVASLKDLRTQELGEKTTQNFFDLFDKIKRGAA